MSDEYLHADILANYEHAYFKKSATPMERQWLLYGWLLYVGNYFERQGHKCRIPEVFAKMLADLDGGKAAPELKKRSRGASYSLRKQEIISRALAAADLMHVSNEGPMKSMAASDRWVWERIKNVVKKEFTYLRKPERSRKEGIPLEAWRRNRRRGLTAISHPAASSSNHTFLVMRFAQLRNSGLSHEAAVEELLAPISEKTWRAG